MNKLGHIKQFFLMKSSNCKRPRTGLLELYRFQTGKDKDDDNFEVEEKYKSQKGVLHDKQQSIQEESFFHKETQEQLKALKKKFKKDKGGKTDSGNN